MKYIAIIIAVILYALGIYGVWKFMEWMIDVITFTNVEKDNDETETQDNI